MPQQLALFALFYTLAVMATIMMEWDLRPWWNTPQRTLLLLLLAWIAWPEIIAYEIVELHRGRLVGEARP